MAGAAYPAGLLDTLRGRDLMRSASALAQELGMPFADPPVRNVVEGIYQRRIDLASGRFALIERARDFTLVPWRPVIEPMLGRRISGALHAGGIDWTLARGRKEPSIE